MASLGERQIWGSSWFAGVLLGIGAISIVHSGSTAGITAWTTAVPPVLSVAHGRADAQLMERAGQQKLFAVEFGQPVPWGSSPGTGLGSSPSSRAGGFGFHQARWWQSRRLGAQSGVPGRIVH